MSMRRWLAGVGLMVMAVPTGACTGASVPGGVTASPGDPGTPTSGVQTSTAATPSATATATATGAPPVLSGTRQVTMTRVDAVESGLSVNDDGRLVEADDDSGRQLFVPTPVDADIFLIKAYRGGGGGPGTGEPVCWQVHNPGDARPLVVQSAACAEDEPRQRFTITAADGATEGYLISNNSAFLRHSRQSGLILEELGDAAPTSSFRFNDNGPAPDRT
ncbi:hypothetical protein ACQPYA_15385 [Micromonospora sp. CA-263727]|uniref:hypothetical protein n=1 Tax=Micromonospora sp. CA-263727 TaxID=3239967 RepID=UPI003D8FC1E2